MEYDDLIECMTEELRLAYCMHRSRVQQVNFNVKSEKWIKYFTNAAKVCARGGYNPAEFMEVQFHAIKPWPSIAVACSGNAESRFLEHQKSYMETIRISVEVQMQIFENLSKMEPVEEILTDEDLEFDALFIHIAATIHGLDKIAIAHRDGALLEYMSSAHYGKVYGAAVPEWLVAAGKKFRKVGGCANVH